MNRKITTLAGLFAAGAFAAQAGSLATQTAKASTDLFVTEVGCGGDKKEGKDHKCGKCGGEKKKDGKCAGDKKKDGKCGGDKKKDGKCGADKKGKDGSCSKGSCGSEKKKG